MGVMPVPSTVIQLGEEFVCLGPGSGLVQLKHFFLSSRKWERKGRVHPEKWGVKEKGGDLIL